MIALDPALRDELAAYKAGAKFTESDEYVFPGRPRDGKQVDGSKRRHKDAVRTRVLYNRASKRPPDQAGAADDLAGCHVPQP
jgi:hypothetical protein